MIERFVLKEVSFIVINDIFSWFLKKKAYFFRVNITILSCLCLSLIASINGVEITKSPKAPSLIIRILFLNIGPVAF